MTVSLGVFFLLFQGYEWVSLIHGGLNMTVSLGAFFFLIIGVHAVHTFAAQGFLMSFWYRLTGPEIASRFSMARYFWYFIITLWPILFLTLYLP